MRTSARPTLRLATAGDAPLLAQFNRHLIQDEGHENPAGHNELVARMRRWLAGEYTAAIAEIEGEPVAYLLWRPGEDGGVHLRQFFVSRAWRHRGVGQATLELATGQLWPGRCIELDVLTHNQLGRQFWHAVGFTGYSLRLRRTPPPGNG